MNKRKISLLLAAVLVCTSLPFENLLAKEVTSEKDITIIRKSDEEAESEKTGKTEETEVVKETIEIRTAEEFISFAENCHLDAWSRNKIVELKENIDLSGKSFEPIPIFDGTFRGNGHTISGFRNAGNGYVVGLFRYISKNGSVEKLTLEGDVKSSDEKQCIGGLCGSNAGIIKDCKFKGTVSGKTETGGIAGVNQATGIIENCVAEGRIIGYYYTGGIAGRNHGNISDCFNGANINDNSAWVEEEDQSGGIEWIRSVGNGETAKLQSGVDTGGIAGYTDGVVVSCSNSGTIGYEHTGYNIGGIAGRQAGILSSCSNKGIVYGRKDVGGIVGQMEPYIKMSKAESIEEEIQKLHDLIDKALDDMGATKDVLTADCDTLIGYSDGALDKSHVLVSQMSDFVDDNMGAVNQVMDRLEYVVNKLPAVLDPLSDSLKNITEVNNDIKKLNDDLRVIGQMEITDYDETDYRRLSLLTSIGGSLTAANNDPAEGANVSLKVQPDKGYGLKSISARDADGNELALTGSGENYSFTMPKQNVMVAAEFEYKGAYLAASTAGGQVFMDESADTLDISVTASDNYTLSSLSVGGRDITAGLDDKHTITVNKSDYPADGSPVLVYATFYRTTAEHQDMDNIRAMNPRNGDIKRETLTQEEPEDTGTDTGESDNTEDGTKEPDSQEKELESPDDQEDGIENPDDQGNDTENPDDQEDGIENPDDQGSDTENPDDQGSDTENPDDQGNDTENPDDQGSDTEAPDDQGNNAENPDDQENNISDINETDTEYIDLIEPDEEKEPDEEEGEKHTISCAGGTGGVIISELQTASAGTEVRIISTQRSGYRLKKLTITSEGSAIEYSRTDSSVYMFTMPEADVVAEAEYEPICFILTSNVGGSASYTVNDSTIIFTVYPNAGYTLSGDPAVVAQDGSGIPLSRRKAGSFEYEFSFSEAQQPVKAAIQFTKQNQYGSIQAALDSITANANELSGAMNRASALAQEIRSIIMNDDGTIKDWSSLTGEQKDMILSDILELSEQLASAGRAASSILSSVSLIRNVVQPYLSQTAQTTHDDIERTMDHLQEVVNCLSDSSDAVKGIINYLNGQQNINFTPLGEDFERNIDDLYNQLQGISGSMKNINRDIDAYSDVLNEDFWAVNDQLNIVLLMFIDRMERWENPDTRTIYEDISDEDIEGSTEGKVSQCTNKGIVQGDINVGGVAGSMAIDEEDPEDNAAGSVEFSLGSTYLTKCIINDCKNYGYITAKKDGAGCIVGYMNLGIAANCEAYGSAESTEGDYVGGICGQSLAMIQKCYSLCTLSGGKYVGGIAGYGDAINNCYAMVDAKTISGRAGAIAGQVVSKEDEEILKNIKDNFYVGDELFGIDDISYVGAAEPVTYEELLTVAGLPVDYRHLRVTFMSGDICLGAQELKYGESLSMLDFPELEDKENTNGVWPDVSDKKMTGNLVLSADYQENISVLESEEKQTVSEETETELMRKALAFAEGEFTGRTVLHAVREETVVPPDSVAKGKDYIVYHISLENPKINKENAVPLRLLNDREEDVSVWQYTDDKWNKMDTKVRGQYVQLTMQGDEGIFCMVYQDRSGIKVWLTAGGCIAGALLLLLIVKKGKKIIQSGKKRRHK